MGICGWLGTVLAGSGGGRTGNDVAEAEEEKKEEEPQLFSAPKPEAGGCVGACVNEAGLGLEKGSRGAATGTAVAAAAGAEAFPLTGKSESSSNVTHCCLRGSRAGAGAGPGAGRATTGTGLITGAGAEAGAGMGVRGVMERAACLGAKADMADMVLWKAEAA